MEGPISESIKKRLPRALRDLDEDHQKAFIYLRLRKKKEEISRLLKKSLSQTEQIIHKIKEELSKAGLLDLIEDPTFISLHADDPDGDDTAIPVEADSEKKLIIKEFLSFLKEAMAELPESLATILKLRYRDNLSAREMLAFAKKVNLVFIPGKAIEEVKEQDIFYSLKKALEFILIKLKERYQEQEGEPSLGIDNLKNIFEIIEV